MYRYCTARMWVGGLICLSEPHTIVCWLHQTSKRPPKRYMDIGLLYPTFSLITCEIFRTVCYTMTFINVLISCFLTLLAWLDIRIMFCISLPYFCYTYICRLCICQSFSLKKLTYLFTVLHAWVLFREACDRGNTATNCVKCTKPDSTSHGLATY